MRRAFRRSSQLQSSGDANGMPEGDIEMWLLCLREACETRDAGRLVVALKEIVLDYSPSAHLLKRVIPARAVPA